MILVSRRRPHASTRGKTFRNHTPPAPAPAPAPAPLADNTCASELISFKEAAHNTQSATNSNQIGNGTETARKNTVYFRAGGSPTRASSPPPCAGGGSKQRGPFECMLVNTLREKIFIQESFGAIIAPVRNTLTQEVRCDETSPEDTFALPLTFC
ncbi:hypothetical protein EVAR_54165_1 [Eumeta japonica]|uniref:Uncharacterized protein n=1 Tax=Eumeta variegata TaxID=151549 RepID=A0A4C1XZY6_EUMVA|nr:hypothetical protein EVAR_54165_1 [Eumeta japonica]